MATYIHERKKWPKFTWRPKHLMSKLAEVRYQQGRLMGIMDSLSSHLKEEANLHNLTLDALASSEIEGEILHYDQVRQYLIARFETDGNEKLPSELRIEGIAKLTIDSARRYQEPLTGERLFGWHAAMFPTGRSGIRPIVFGKYRVHSEDDPMQVLSGTMGNDKIHFQAPAANILVSEMTNYLEWFNSEKSLDPVLKSAIAHLWFITLHPFADGNGRISRAITDMQLARSVNSAQRYYSMSSQIMAERDDYFNVLEATQKGTLDISDWLNWFLNCLSRAMTNTDNLLSDIFVRARFWEKHIAVSFNDRQRVMISKMLDGFDGKLTSSNWARITKTSQDSATRDINDLVQRGILAKEQAGGRSTRYILAR